MSSKQQMKRGKTQSLYKYLPETWIDFSVRGKERKQYIAKVLRWNSEKLDGINAKRLIRTVNEAVRSFENQASTPGPIKPTIGFGAELTKDNCDVLTPKASEEERGIVAQISPLTFYCKHCYKVYQFSNEEEYMKRRVCTNPECHHAELTQFRQIYFCKCGYATDRHNPRCPEHGYQYVKWDGHFDFVCTKCKRPIPMQVKCPTCGDMLRPKVALDPAQFFVFSLSLIDLIDENLERFISESEYGPYITFAYWLGMISKEELDEIIKNGIVSDPEAYQKVYDQFYQLMLTALKNEVAAATAAKTAADQQCGNRFNDIVTSLKGKVFTTEEDISSIAERILEYDLVTRLDDVSDLASAVDVARLLNTNANPEQYAQIAERFGIKSARVCDRVPFVSCSYGYTRVESEYYALKEQLPDKYQVFYSVRWFETVDNKRIDSESDFLVFDPSFGFITIEVKGGTGITVEDGTWTLIEDYGPSNSSSRVLKCSPYEQAEKSMRHFRNYFVSEFNQNYNGVYGFAVAFPRYAITDQLAQEAPPETTIDLNDMTSLREKINRIFHYWKNKRNISIPFSAEQRTRFITAINKQISMSAAAGALIPIKEKEFSKINFVQDSILDCLHNYTQAQIVGGAGTGKTFIGIKKAVRDALDGKKVLFTCCNEELAAFVQTRLCQYESITVYTYNQLMRELLGAQYDSLPTNTNGNKNCFELMDQIEADKKYDSIIIDEAQDFDIDMGFAIRSLLRDEGSSSLYVFYDKNQNVFEMDFENAFAIDAPPYVLRYNIRNTGSIYKCAVERTNLGHDTVANSIVGVHPEIHNYSKPSQAIKALSLIVNRLVQKEFVSPQSIVIVSDTPYANSILAGEDRIGALAHYG